MACRGFHAKFYPLDYAKTLTFKLLQHFGQFQRRRHRVARMLRVVQGRAPESHDAIAEEYIQ